MAARRKSMPPAAIATNDVAYENCTPAVLQQFKEQGFRLAGRFLNDRRGMADVAIEFSRYLRRFGHETVLLDRTDIGTDVWSVWTEEAAALAAETSSPWPFSVGDVVQLKSGGGKMVVSELLCRGHVRVTYWCGGPPDADFGLLRETDFDPLLIHKVDPVSPHDDIPF